MNLPASNSSNTFPEIVGYAIVEQLYLGSRTVVYRAVQTTQQRLVVIKMLQREYPSSDELVQFRSQYTITKNLPSRGIVQPLGLESLGSSYALVMEDWGGVSLEKYTQQQSLDLMEVLTIALQLADILQDLSQHQVVHKDIKPANILIHPESKQVKLMDFSIASLLPKETQEIENPNILEGTLAYLAPEQSGRMNRGIDYRADFYALGVTLYQLLSGTLPFISEDPLELLHCHIAKIPQPVNQVNLAIPEMVAAIVSKLMAKNAEERYQTAIGLKYDLQQCLTQWEETGEILAFELGQRDVSDRFLIPEKLYGRAAEVQALLDAFDRVAAGSSELTLVAGFSGIGKTAIVNEVHKPITRQNGYFIKGKFDQFNRNIPFSAFVQAFRSLIAQLLSDNDAQLQIWKTQILAALGDNSQVIIEVIPELEWVIGSQPPAVELSGTAAQNRFNRLFQKFIQVFTTPEHPLVMFLDDLQWADSASLNLIQVLMAESTTGYLLLLGAYRDNEVFAAHPLMLTLDTVCKAGATVNEITLQPLSQPSLNQLIADTLHCAEQLAQPLTELVMQKTQGNPFFATQFLKALYQDKLIIFAADAGHWQCDIVRVQDAALTDDVVEFMALQLQKLPQATQGILKLAACIGSQFDLPTLAIVCEESITETATGLWAALQDGFIVPLDRIYKFFQVDSESRNENPGNLTLLDADGCKYRFLHDRVQQAAYSLIPPDRANAVHLQIGRLLLARIPVATLDLQIFQIVNQLNYGISLITAAPERQELAQLNQQAAQQAKAATAYDAALKYADTGLELLPSQSWATQYPITLELYQLAAEVAYLNGNYKRTIELLAIGLAQTKHQLDRVKFYEIQILVLVGQNQPRQAVEYARKALSNFGVYLPQKPSPLKTAWGFLTTVYRMIEKSPQDLLKLPPMSAPKKLAACSLFNSVGAATAAGMPEMLPFITFEGIALYLRYGNVPKSSMGYIIYAYLICEKFGQVNRGYAIGKAAIELCHQYNSKAALAPTLFLWHRFIAYRQESRHETLPVLLQAYQVSLEVGDVEYAAYSLITHFNEAYWLGHNLQDIQQEAIAILPTVQDLQQPAMTLLHQLTCQKIESLTTVTLDPCQLNGQWFDENAIADRDLANNNQIYTSFTKLNLAVLFHRYPVAMAEIPVIEQRLQLLDGTALKLSFYFYAALGRLGQYPQLTKKQQQATIAKIRASRQHIAKLAKTAPMNYQQQVLLLDAELLRISGKWSQAADLYDQAIAAAQTNLYLQEEALANELAARFYLNLGKEKVAAGYMQEAYYCYAKWGATAKTADLETSYPQLLRPILQSEFQPINMLKTLASISAPNYSIHSSANSSRGSNSSFNTVLDFVAILKVSQSLAGTIELDELLCQFTQIILQNSGGDRCALMLPNLDGEWSVVAIATPEANEICAEPLEGNTKLPVQLIQYVKNTHETVIIHDGKTESPIADPYLNQRQPKSVLCLPILNKGKLMGILYLKNLNSSGVFTSDRLLLLNFLCTQAAIALENAQLYRASRQSTAELQVILAQLQQSENRFKDLFHQSAYAIVLLGQQGFIECNPAAFKLFGYTPDELYKMHPSQISPEFQANGQSSLEAANEMMVIAAKNGSHQFEWLHQRANGEIFWTEVMVTLIPYAEEHIFHGVVIDISDRKQAELQLQQTNEELIRATRLKDQFLANMSHELRTPLNAILGMTEGLTEQVFGNVNDRQLKALATIERSGSHLLELINDILDVAKIESGHIELDFTPTSTTSLCQASLTFIKQQAHTKQITLETKFPANLPDLMGDERRIRQVIINLLNNAVKFTPAGGRITLEVKNTRPSFLQISITDTGIGISPANIKKLFQPFIQIDSSLNRQYEGTGLGLALVKRIVELHGGSVGLTSEVGVGSCFSVELPCVNATAQRLQLESTTSADNLESAVCAVTSPLILLAEDNSANISTISSYLEAKGYRLVVANNGQEAIDLVKSARPDLVLMDIQMPGMDGFEAMQEIRSHPQFADLPIIALTALAMTGDREKCIAAGANDYISKPIKLKNLAQSIQQLLVTPDSEQNLN
ncbi:AAA family ATPase [Calothrix sp. PCC 6303]|uniref:AAA family ATPase n=1 Tax=Calothrix sp. PCC 6303 TaxID=1170562 RepID=UPI0002A01BBD|nr:AAA family ATPase [Calothrix sp. PCC 6303]AFZ02494.1 PAS sensor protein [Calothrix sp. PCC 6303]